MPASGYPNTVPLSEICHFDLPFSLELTISDNRKASVKPTSIDVLCRDKYVTPQ